jgi:hypothetical protein
MASEWNRQGLGRLEAFLAIVRRKSVWVLATLALTAVMLAVPRIARGQASDSDSNSSTSKTSTSTEKVKLSDVTRVSTEEAARQAAKEKAKSGQSSSAKPDDETKKADQEEAASSPVSELQPAKKTSKDKAATDDPTAEVGSSNARKIHGSVHGASGSGARQGGAEVGAGTKSGKTHVYVETDRTTTPQPH